MITPLDIEEKKFSKKTLNGYNTEEVDDFLDEITIDYEKIYKEASEARKTIENLNNELSKYKQMEETLRSTLLMAQSTADEVKRTAQKRADSIVAEAQNAANEEINKINAEVEQKRKELEKKNIEIEDINRKYDECKGKIEKMLVSQLELLKSQN